MIKNFSKIVKDLRRARFELFAPVMAANNKLAVGADGTGDLEIVARIPYEHDVVRGSL